VDGKRLVRSTRGRVAWIVYAVFVCALLILLPKSPSTIPLAFLALVVPLIFRLSRNVAFGVLAVTLSTLISLGCAEMMFRWYSERVYDDKFPEWTDNLVVMPGARVFAFKPNASGVFPGGVDAKRTFPYRTNAHGLRDRDRPAKRLGTTRVLVIGDSYTWGYAVAEEEAYPQVAERLLVARGRPDIEVINGGIPDYNSRQERELLKELLPIYQPDAVFLAYVVNDAEPTTAMPVPPDETYRHSRSWFLTEVAERLNHRLFRRRFLPSAKDNVGASYLDGFEEGSVKWRDSRDAIREMRDLASAAGIPFTVFILPDVTQHLDDRYPWRTINEAVSRWGRELGIPTFDLLAEAFHGRDQQTLVIPWDGHPNAQAHREFAEFLVARILEHVR
jgi:lysophospholipase L1-like esterase